jgi:hypothetical protein
MFHSGLAIGDRVRGRKLKVKIQTGRQWIGYKALWEFAVQKAAPSLNNSGAIGIKFIPGVKNLRRA